MTLIADKDDSALEQNRRRLIQDFRREAAHIPAAATASSKAIDCVRVPLGEVG